MKHRMILTIVFLVTAMCFSGTTGRISGRVIDAKTGLAIHAANVFVVGTNYGASTDKDGLFLIKDVPPGKYVISAVAKGYDLTKMQDITIKVDKTITVNFSLQLVGAMGSAVDGVLADIDGKVIDEVSGNPIEGARVILKDRNVGTETDTKGQFVLKNVWAGIYTILVIADGYQPNTFPYLVVSSNWQNEFKFSLKPEQKFLNETFNLKYISGDEAVSMLAGYYEGVISVSDHFITVRTTVANSDKIKQKLKELDIPPKQIWLEVQLILASPRASGQDLPEDLSHIKKQLTSLFKYKDYYLLDDARIMAYQNQPCSFVVGQGGYRIQIKKVEYHDIQKGLIKLQHFDLKSEELNQYVLNTSVNIQNGNTVILGASNVDASGQALITVVTAKTVN